MNHHPGEDLLLEYSSGGLAVGPALCVRTHLEQCHCCAQQVQNMNVLGAAMLQYCESEAVSDDLLDKTLAQLDATPPVANPSSKLGGLRQLLPSGLAGLNWQRLAPGVSFFDLPAANEEGFIVKLLRVGKGRSVFQHTHSGNEFTVLLQGGYSDELGSYSAGDFIECDASHVHKPVAHRDQDCILLTAVSGDLRFTGRLTRLLNPVFTF